jgi:putative hydrolase of HD superfamily
MQVYPVTSVSSIIIVDAIILEYINCYNKVGWQVVKERNIIHQETIMERLKKQIEFLLEIDKLKTILRRNYISNGTKRENDAEHSWYFAIAALLLSEYSNNDIDIQRVVNMALIHDIVEVDAGDTFVYDEKAKESQNEREEKAAKRLFGILPEDQRSYFSSLWNEFEGNSTNESKFARSIDRLVAIFLNYQSKGKAWKENNVGYQQIYEINKRIEAGSSELWQFVEEIINKAVDQGILDKKTM